MANPNEVIGRRRARWEKATAVPMLVIAGLFIVAYSFWVLLPDVHALWRAVLIGYLGFSWVLFAVDYLVRIVLSPRGRWAFVRYNIMDLLAVVVPFFRAFRLLRSLREIDYFRKATGDAVRTQVVAYAVLFATLFIYMLSLAELQAERDAPGATITTFGTAVWWACVTMATVGYGDTYPVTAMGRMFAVALMIGGVAIVGTASAIVISYLNERIAPARRAVHEHDNDKKEER